MDVRHLNTFPHEWPHDLLPVIRARVRASERKVVVLDDDPTGTQTVHDVPVLTEWSVKTLAAELQGENAAFYILTNSRSLPLSEARYLNRAIGLNVRAASDMTGTSFALVSRSDSTLRGHYPGEVDALVEALQRDYDSILLVPFFLEGGRITCNDVHYVAEGERLIPVAETPYAQDPVFGYGHSNLREWIEEKTGGGIAASSITSLSIQDIRQGGPERVTEVLLDPKLGRVCVVNSISYRDQEVLVAGLLEAEAQGRQFLYRTAASFVRIRAGIAARPLLRRPELITDGPGGGLFVIGSYVPKTTSQLKALISCSGVVGLEVSVRDLLRNNSQHGEIGRITKRMNDALRRGRDVAIYTGRDLITGDDDESNLSIGRRISDSLIEIVAALEIRPRYVLAKGGITSSDVATKGLNVRRALISGQILPGVPVWQLGDETRFPGLSYIVFPGNVGSDDALTAIQEQLARK